MQLLGAKTVSLPPKPQFSLIKIFLHHYFLISFARIWILSIYINRFSAKFRYYARANGLVYVSTFGQWYDSSFGWTRFLVSLHTLCVSLIDPNTPLRQSFDGALRNSWLAPFVLHFLIIFFDTVVEEVL